MQLELVSVFKYLECDLEESGADGVECSKKVASGRRVAGAFRSLGNTLLVPVLMYVSETMLWKEKERYRIRAVQMDNFRGLLVIRKLDRVLNAWIIELCGVTKGLMKVFSDGLAMWKKWRTIGLSLFFLTLTYSSLFL